MKLYDLTSTFTFGRHEGQTVAQVVAENPGYLNFCLQALDHFVVRRADMEAWQQQYPKLQRELTEAAWAKLDAKEQQLRVEHARQQAAEEADRDEPSSYYSSDDADRDTFDALTDGQYGDYDDFNGDFDSLRDSMGY